MNRNRMGYLRSPVSRFAIDNSAISAEILPSQAQVPELRRIAVTQFTNLTSVKALRRAAADNSVVFMQIRGIFS
jgi:hypothetical protein